MENGLFVSLYHSPMIFATFRKKPAAMKVCKMLIVLASFDLFWTLIPNYPLLMKG